MVALLPCLTKALRTPTLHRNISSPQEGPYSNLMWLISRFDRIHNFRKKREIAIFLSLAIQKTSKWRGAVQKAHGKSQIRMGEF